MLSLSHLLVPLIAGMVSIAAQAQWDATTLAKGWARVDVTGAVAFQDSAAQVIHIWTRDGMLSGDISLSKLDRPAEKWVIDNAMNAWVISGSTLLHVDKSGKIKDKSSLPGEVSDLTWDAKNFYLIYKSTEPYVEKREFKNGDVVWSYGNKPRKETLTTLSLFRIAISDDGFPLIVVGNGLGCLPLDAKGRVQNLIQFTMGGQPAPALKMTDKDRAPIGSWFGRNMLLTAVRASELPSSEGKNWFLIKQDLATNTATPMPTPFSEDHLFVGILDAEAVFVKPQGGLAFFKLE